MKFTIFAHHGIAGGRTSALVTDISKVWSAGGLAHKVVRARWVWDDRIEIVSRGLAYVDALRAALGVPVSSLGRLADGRWRHFVLTGDLLTADGDFKAQVFVDLLFRAPTNNLLLWGRQRWVEGRELGSLKMGAFELHQAWAKDLGLSAHDGLSHTPAIQTSGALDYGQFIVEHVFRAELKRILLAHFESGKFDHPDWVGWRASNMKPRWGDGKLCGKHINLPDTEKLCSVIGVPFPGDTPITAEGHHLIAYLLAAKS